MAAIQHFTFAMQIKPLSKPEPGCRRQRWLPVRKFVLTKVAESLSPAPRVLQLPPRNAARMAQSRASV